MSLLSIIIPAYNEGALIQNTASVVADIMEKHSIDYEIVFVNDGSKDATWDEIQCLPVLQVHPESAVP